MTGPLSFGESRSGRNSPRGLSAAALGTNSSVTQHESLCIIVRGIAPPLPANGLAAHSVSAAILLRGAPSGSDGAVPLGAR